MGDLIARYAKGIIAGIGALGPLLLIFGIEMPENLPDKLVNVVTAISAALVVIIPNKPAPEAAGAKTRSPAFVGVLALVIGTLALQGCAGTQDAYVAASEREGVEKLTAVAFVVGEHYKATVREMNRADDEGSFSQTELRQLQTIVRETAPVILALLAASETAQLVQDSETEADLVIAIDNAALALQRLIVAVQDLGRANNSSAPRPFAPLELSAA